MAKNVYIDFETRSELDVRKTGAWPYSRHPSTSILCLAIAIDDGPVVLFKPDDLWAYDEKWYSLTRVVDNPDVVFHAHNAFFEESIWQNIMVPQYNYEPIPIERWRCTAAKAASMSLPRSLHGVGKALNLEVQKDDEGHRLMLTLSKPRQSGKFWEYQDRPTDFEKLYKYCMRDVEVERNVDRLLPDLNPREQKVWFLDQKINFKGVHVDVATVHQISDFIGRTQESLISEFRELTGGWLNSPGQIEKMKEWLANHGCELPDLTAARVAKAIKNERDPEVKRVLEIRGDLAKTSTKKYPAILARVDTSDSRLRDCFLYYAAITGRWGGRGVQLQNLPRGTVNSDTAINVIKNDNFKFFNDCYSDPMGVYSSCIRGVFTASPGNELYVCDFAGIEARVVAWLAGQEDTLNIFRRGEDIYCIEATATFGRAITKKDKAERMIGKVETLALGFGGGINAFGTMAIGYNVDLEPVYDIIWPGASTEEKEKARFAYDSYVKRQTTAGEIDILSRPAGLAADVIKQRWRLNNPQIVEYWKLIENAAIQAVLTGEKVSVGPNPIITFGMLGEHLLAKLPSGNCLVYPFAQVSQKTNDWGTVKATLNYKVEDENTYQFGRKWTYGGRLVENLTQAVARDLMAAALLRIDNAGFNIVLHAHDEIGADELKGLDRFEEFCRLMAEAPRWADGLPIDVEGWHGQRYRK